MKFKPKAKIKVQLGVCKTCRKPITNPFTHVCVIDLSKPARGAAKKKGAAKRRKKK